ncbi:MAG: serine hydrolase [Acidobacteria bacterium]|nr:serine hydrolase [Acidobacteriota bacterium]
MYRLILSIIAFSLFSAIAQANPWVARHGLTGAEYQAEFNKWTGQGYRLEQVSGYSVGNQVFYAAIWEKKPGPAYVARHGLTGAAYQAEFNTWTGQGYRLILVDGYGAGNQALYAAIWEKSPGPAQVARHGMTSAQYQAEFNKWTGQGFRLSLVEGYGVGNQAYYAAIWEKKPGPAMVARHGLTSAEYQAEFNKWVNQGFRLIHVSGYTVSGDDRYAAIWEKSPGPAFIARHGLRSVNYQTAFDNAYYRGYKLKLVSGYADGNSARYAAIFENDGAWNLADLKIIDDSIKEFMQKFAVPGASVAITKDGRLVFAQGYGFANKEEGLDAGPRHLFRLASVSKPITGVAIMKLVEQNKLKLSDKVFGAGSLLGTMYGSKAYGAREKEITIQQLLEHTAGGSTWNNNGDDGSGDPMFQQGAFNHKQLIGWVLDERDPSDDPGKTYSYSNFGYCVLGRVIEKVTGQPYESWVKANVLSPTGAKDMHIAGDTFEERRTNEVSYYGGNVYGMQVTRMDAHGGWLANPIDLLRFMVRVDGFPTKPDILKPGTVTLMTTGSTANKSYAKGWGINLSNGSWSHGGSLPGTSTLLWRTSDGYTVAFLLNMRSSDSQFDLGKPLKEIVTTVKKWPSIDLF